MTDDTDYELILYRAGTAGTITLSKSGADSTVSGGVMSRTWIHDENNISQLVVTLDNASLVVTENLLRSSCALWSNSVTGALQMGDYVRYSIYPTSSPSTKTQVFYGKITELRPAADGTLQITARDYLQKFYREYNKIVFNSYNDLAIKPHTDSGGLRTITGISESNIVIPAVFVGFATTDARTTLNGTGTYLDPLYDGTNFFTDAQSFVALGDDLIGLRYYYQSGDITTDGHIHCAIRADVNGLPSGTDIVYSEYLVGLGSNVNTPVQIDFSAGTSSPAQLTKGSKYWVVFSCDATIVGTFVSIIYHTGTPTTAFDDTYWWRQLPSGTWTQSVAGDNLTLRLDFADYVEVAPADYMVDLPNTRLILRTSNVPVTTVDSYYSIYRGKVSYYYGTITHRDICNTLTCLMGGVAPTTSANQSQTFNLYNTIGKKLIDCFKEIVDVWELGGAWSGFQHAFMAYESGGVQYIGWGKRYTLNQAAAFIFSWSDDATDDHLRILDYTGLVNQIDVRPAGILVIGGKDVNGNPIVASVSDKSLATSFATQMEDFTNVEKISDQNIVSQPDAFRRAYAALDSYARGQWEGTIRVSGVYPDLFVLDPTDGFFGSGKIITLNISPLGIVNQPFKVRGIVVHENETEITLTNVWSSIENRTSKTFLKTDRSEAFLAQVGMEDNVYFQCFKDVALSSTPLYMVLVDAMSVELGARVLCSYHPATSYSAAGSGLIVYHAEFEAGNDTTTSGSYPVSHINLYDAVTGGTLKATYYLYDNGPPIRNEQFFKWKTQRLIVDFATKA